MLAGRVLSGVSKALIFSRGQFSLLDWATASFVTCLPGIVIHLAVIPTLIFALVKAGLVPPRYPAKKEVSHE